MRESIMFYHSGPTLTFYCVVYEGREDPNTTKTGHHRRFAGGLNDGPTLNAGLVAW